MSIQNQNQNQSTFNNNNRLEKKGGFKVTKQDAIAFGIGTIVGGVVVWGVGKLRNVFLRRQLEKQEQLDQQAQQTQTQQTQAEPQQGQQGESN